MIRFPRKHFIYGHEYDKKLTADSIRPTAHNSIIETTYPPRLPYEEREREIE